MELIRGLHNLRERHHGCVATIGNFDGVHLGHARVIDQLKSAAEAYDLPGLVILFEPQPQEYFAGQRAPARLMCLSDKLLGMRVHGVDRVLCLRFNEKLAALSAEDFVNQVLHQGLGIKHLVVGDDFRFGARRRGDFAMLQRMGAVLGFDVESMQTVMMDGERVSSTRIRSALMQGELDQVRHLTGRHYAIVGRVIHGDKLGRTIGFPTVNIRLHRRVAPIEGIYAVRISGERIGMHDGVAYSGRRPTVSGEDHRLEVFIFDFDGDVYGQRLKVELLSFLRPDKKFDSLDELKSQIAEDVDNARQYLADRVV